MRSPLREGVAPGAQGTSLHWRIWEAPEPEMALLVIHGLGEHSGRYTWVGETLSSRGVTVFSFDLRGHGLSGGPRGDVEAFPRFVEDLVAMEGVLEGEIKPGLPWFLLGHSLGGLIGLRRILTLREPYAGAVLSAPWMATALPDWVCRLGAGLGLIFPWLPVPSGLGAERLTRDSEMAAAWREDPLIHKRITARLFREANRTQEEVRRGSGRLTLPLLFLIPSEDRVVRGAATETFARGIVGGEVQVEILKGGRHEPFNDLDRWAVTDLVVDWLKGRGSGLSGPS